jgi:hypothetical protein
MGTLKPTQTEQVESLRRHRAPNGVLEELGGWLQRVDAATVGEATYRSAGFPADDLWQVLEDPEADVHVRAAAARLLTRATRGDSLASEARVRVGAVLAAERSAKAVSRIRVAAFDEAPPEDERLDVWPDRANRA